MNRHGATESPPARSSPHRLGANGTPQAWRPWKRRRFNLPRSAAPAQAAELVRLREPAAPRGAQTEFQVASARAHRGAPGRASPEAGLGERGAVSRGARTSGAELALRLRSVIKVVVIN